MSKAYREANNVEVKKITTAKMRKYCQRPGSVLKDGRPAYYTEQNHTKQCDVNEIIKKYDQHGLISHVNRLEAKYGDMTGKDYKESLDLVIKVKREFDELPSNIRKEFSNDPAEYLAFMENPENRDRAIELGLIEPTWAEELDGLGEHVDEEKQKQREKAAEAENDTA